MTGIGGENGHEAMKLEIESLERLKTWEMMQTPEGQKIVKTKLVYHLRRDSKGNIIRYKVMLVTKRSYQIPGIDVSEVIPQYQNL